MNSWVCDFSFRVYIIKLHLAMLIERSTNVITYAVKIW